MTDLLVLGAGVAGRLDGGRHDQGAQFVTLQHREVADLTGAMRDRGALVEWFRGAPDVDRPPRATDGPTTDGADGADGHPRYRGAPSARGPAELLAERLADVRTGVTVTAPAVTVHSTGAWARDHLEDDHTAVGEMLATVAGTLLDVTLRVRHVHRWRPATPTAHGSDPAPCGHVGGRVEGAMLSGHLAAARLSALR